MQGNLGLRRTFNEDARLYDQARPRYPEDLFDSIVKETQLKDRAKLLEIGPGTGQATESFVKRRYDITAVELGSDLADVARIKFAESPNVVIHTGSFEDTVLPPNDFDLIYSATAFHWIAPDVRFKKSHYLLNDGGHLAIIGTNHVSDEKGDYFFFSSQPIYMKYGYGGRHDENYRLKKAMELKSDKVDENLFSPIFYQRYPLIISYTADKYTQLLSTYSPTISLQKDRRRGFLKDIGDLIDVEFKGKIQKHYSMTLTIAKKK